MRPSIAMTSITRRSSRAVPASTSFDPTFDDYILRWHRLRPPFRPDGTVVKDAEFRRQLASQKERRDATSSVR
jgi:hypothetical protein